MVSHETTARPEYWLSRYVDSTSDPMEWQLGNTIDMDMAWTSYNVEVRYEELNDYNSSEVVRADAIYYFAGDVEVRIICDEGIKYDFTPRTHQGSESNEKYLDGADLTLEILDGYYIVGG